MNIEIEEIKKSVLIFEDKSSNMVSFNTALHKFLLDLKSDDIIKTFGVVYTSFKQMRIAFVMHDDSIFDELFTYEGATQ